MEVKPIYRNIGCKRVQESETSSDFVLALGLVDLIPSARAALTVVLLLFLLPCGAARLPVLATFLFHEFLPSVNILPIPEGFAQSSVRCVFVITRYGGVLSTRKTQNTRQVE
ncbi:hypothetical protein BJ508DRAFT_167709 [Ascobolus immersus RN42]|uniref:Uncharacterized protein n=1 Tax=Ascobolus immersus RN42 TaxID=1160509 RepID=A0A3N4IIX4_ASCIM|nr:hypothetical protein BJ508DRAFT_167709 [Ascobolus immersus RN42]